MCYIDMDDEMELVRVLSFLGAIALWIAALMAISGCTRIEIRTLPDDQWQATYHTFLKDIKADQIEAERNDGTLRLNLRQYESTETKALDVAAEAIKRVPVMP